MYLGVFNDVIESCPRHRVYDTDEGVLLSVELPGVEKRDINVEFANGVLSIYGARRPITGQDATKFSQKFNVPETFISSKIEAEFKNGVLTISIPKKEEFKARKIAIK